MLKTTIYNGLGWLILELIFSLIVCIVSFRRHKSFLKLIPVFLATFSICLFVSFIILPFPIAIVYDEGYTFDFMSQFSPFDKKAFTTYLLDYIASRERFITTPFLCSFFSTVLFTRLRKPFIFLLSWIGAPTTYAIVNIIINTLARGTIKGIYPNELILIAVGYAVGWILAMLILKAFPSIDTRFKLKEKHE